MITQAKSLAYYPTDVRPLRQRGRGIIMCEGRIAAFDATICGSVAAAINETVTAACADLHDDDEGYPVVVVEFGNASILEICAAALYERVGGKLSLVEPRWERLWYCPPALDALERFICAAARNGCMHAI